MLEHQSKAFTDCKLACATGIEQLIIAKNKMAIHSEHLQRPETTPALLAHAQMIKAVKEAERALKIFMEYDDAMDQ